MTRPRTEAETSGTNDLDELCIDTIRATDGVAVRVVSMPSWELFEDQPLSYREAVLPPAVRARVSVEAAASHGWRRWIGDRGRAVGLDRFGASAPGPIVMEMLGFNAERVAEEARAALDDALRGGSGPVEAAPA